jgi:acetylornithine deacetylase/succinyl-diaminopimelate desuccinylase-like protein
MPSPLDFARSQQARFLEELKSLLRIPSISTLPEHAGDVRFAAESLAREMERVGLELTAIMMSSPPTRWTNGIRPRSSPRSATVTFMPGVQLTTKGRCTCI